MLRLGPGTTTEGRGQAEGGWVLAKGHFAMFAASLCPLVAALNTYSTLHLSPLGEPDPLGLGGAG